MGYSLMDLCSCSDGAFICKSKISRETAVPGADRQHNNYALVANRVDSQQQAEVGRCMIAGVHSVTCLSE